MFLNKKIPVSRPLLPHLDNLIPYLKDIKAENIQSCKRPLILHLEKRLEKLFKTKDGSVCLTSNYVSALTNTLRATGAPEGSYCIMPSWASPALPYAALYAGLKPFFIDVDQHTWAIEPEQATNHLLHIGKNVGAVLIPAPFGHAINTSKWDDFTEETGVPAVIDATTGMDAVLSKSKAAPSKTPIVIGLHPANTLSVDEGGIIVSKDLVIIDRIKRICHFGAEQNSNYLFSGTNSSMSEYKAALCHAALDGWETERAKWDSLTRNYIEILIDTTLHHRLSFDFITSSCNIFLLGEDADKVVEYLKSKGVESRKWWGEGCHAIDDFKHIPKTSLPVTNQLARSVISIPFYIDLSKKEIESIVRLLSKNIYKTKTTHQGTIRSKYTLVTKN